MVTFSWLGFGLLPSDFRLVALPARAARVLTSRKMSAPSGRWSSWRNRWWVSPRGETLDQPSAWSAAAQVQGSADRRLESPACDQQAPSGRGDHAAPHIFKDSSVDESDQWW